jgi:hypothetical protein
VPYEAAKLAVLIADERKWVERRVETVTFISEAWQRRHTSVHFDVPPFADTPGGPAGVALVWVPIAMLKKEVLRQLDVRDEEGAALPVLSARQERLLARELLGQQAKSALNMNQTDSLDPTLADWLDSVTAAEGTVSFDSARTAHVPDAAELLRDGPMRGYLEDLAHNFMLLARLDAKPATTRIVKFTYNSRLDLEETSRRSLRTGIGLFDYGERFSTPAIFDCRSYHVEIACPEELTIAEARLHDVTESSYGRTDRVPLDEDYLVDRAHLYTSGPHSPDVQYGYVVVGFRLKAQVVDPVFVLTAAIAGVIVGGIAVHFLWPTAVRTETAAVVVVAIPSFFATLVAPGNHPIVKRMFFGLRVVAFLAGACSFLAAASLAINPSTHSLVVVWSILAVFSCLLVAIAGSAALHSRRGSRASG